MMNDRDLANALNPGGIRREWYFSCHAPARGPAHDVEGFPTMEEAQSAAEAYATQTHGRAPHYPVRLYVGRSDQIIYSLCMGWPPVR